MKIKILLTLAGMLFAAMLLIALVMIYLSHRFLTQSEISKAQMTAEALASQFALAGKDSLPAAGAKAASSLTGKGNDGFCIGITVSTQNLEVIFTGGEDEALQDKLKALAADAMRRGLNQEAFLGSKWSVLCVQPETYMLAVPIKEGNAGAGAVAYAFSLRAVAADIRNLQQIALIYILINTCIFAAVGFYRFDRFMVKPVHKLIKKATAYRIGDGPFAAYGEAGNEWDILYRAVNRIVDLNAEDNRALKDSLNSLEGAMAELKKAQQEIIRAEKLATVGRLSSGIAHEIGNPIGIILGYIDLLKGNGLSTEDTTDILRRTESEVRRIDRIIRQLLDFSRPGIKQKTKVSVHEILSEILEMTKIQPLFSNIGVELDLLAENDNVTADPGQLHQALLNIVLNAADAMEVVAGQRPGRLAVTSENTEASIKDQVPKPMFKLSFSDNGEGISAEGLNNMFDPFYTTKPPGKGNGLGLWVSMMIIEGFGGKITAESRRGEGTTMSVFLPVEPIDDSVLRG